MNRSLAFLASSLAGIAAATAALAHHSTSMFEPEKRVTLTGNVKEFQWTNPHTWTWLAVTNADGSTTRWGLEGMSPNYLGRRGWSKNTFKPGDKIKVTIWPLKSGEPGGTLQRATLADGTEVVNFARGGG